MQDRAAQGWDYGDSTESRRNRSMLQKVAKKWRNERKIKIYYTVSLRQCSKSNGYCNPQLRRCISLTSSVMASLLHVRKDCSDLSVAETWTLLAADIRKLEAFYVK